MTRPRSLLRIVGWAEAVSFLLLLGVAMPLKYAAGEPLAVKVVGMLHGVLFLAFCVALLRVHLRAKWPLRRSALVFASSLIPFGPFLIDYEAEPTDPARRARSPR